MWLLKLCCKIVLGRGMDSRVGVGLNIAGSILEFSQGWKRDRGLLGSKDTGLNGEDSDLPFQLQLLTKNRYSQQEEIVYLPPR